MEENYWGGKNPQWVVTPVEEEEEEEEEVELCRCIQDRQLYRNESYMYNSDFRHGPWTREDKDDNFLRKCHRGTTDPATQHLIPEDGGRWLRCCGNHRTQSEATFVAGKAVGQSCAVVWTINGDLFSRSVKKRKKHWCWANICRTGPPLEPVGCQRDAHLEDQNWQWRVLARRLLHSPGFGCCIRHLMTQRAFLTNHVRLYSYYSCGRCGPMASLFAYRS